MIARYRSLLLNLIAVTLYKGDSLSGCKGESFRIAFVEGSREDFNCQFEMILIADGIREWQQNGSYVTFVAVHGERALNEYAQLFYMRSWCTTEINQGWRRFLPLGVLHPVRARCLGLVESNGQLIGWIRCRTDCEKMISRS